MQNFTPISALIGGSLIGLSAVLLLWQTGRIAGISGIFHGLFPIQKEDFFWRISFLIGLVLGTWIYFVFPQVHFSPRAHYPKSLLVLSGFIVGVGTRLSSGCTSGHGVCGIARLSPRSFLATVVFFGFGFLTVYFIRHMVNSP